MKNVSNFMVLAVIMLSLGLVSCVKEDPAKPLDVDWTRTAVVKGTLLYNTDLNKPLSEQKWSAPAITSDAFVVTVPYSSLNSGASGTYRVPNKDISYNSNGEFSVTVPVGVNATTITVKVSDFAGSRKLAGADRAVDGIWSFTVGSNPRTVSLMPGQTGFITNWYVDSFSATKTDGSLVNP